MSWIDIKNIKKEELVKGETYSIRAERSQKNFRIFPEVYEKGMQWWMEGKDKYIIDCVGFVKGRKQGTSARGMKIIA